MLGAGGYSPPGHTHPPEGTWYHRYPPPVDGMTDASENITFAQLHWRAVKQPYLTKLLEEDIMMFVQRHGRCTDGRVQYGVHGVFTEQN